MTIFLPNVSKCITEKQWKPWDSNDPVYVDPDIILVQHLETNILVELYFQQELSVTPPQVCDYSKLTRCENAISKRRT